MKVSELQTGDILWLYNSKEHYFAEFEFVQKNEDGTSRFRTTGEISIDEPNYGYGIDSLEFRCIELPDGSTKIKVISTRCIKFKCTKIKEYFQNLFKGVQ